MVQLHLYLFKDVTAVSAGTVEKKIQEGQFWWTWLLREPKTSLVYLGWALQHEVTQDLLLAEFKFMEDDLENHERWPWASNDY